MYRRAGMVPLVAFAVMMLHPLPGAGPRRHQPAPPASLVPQTAPVLPPPSVRIEHELVRLPKAKAPRANRPAERSTRMALASPLHARTPLIVRASRAFVGDGRFKPEPFPRLAR